MKKILLSLGTVSAVVAPIAAVVACGKNTKGLGGDGSHNQGGGLGIPALPASLSAYSVDTLRAEAVKIGDNTVWDKGPAFASISSSVSFIRAVAKELGYYNASSNVSDKNFNDYLTTKNKTLITDADVQSGKYTVGKADATEESTFLASLSQDNNAEQTFNSPYFGDSGFQMSDLKLFGLKSDGKDMTEAGIGTDPYKNADGGNATNGVKPLSLWDDVEHPGQYILSLEYGDFVRQIPLSKGIKEVYPTIDKTLFENEYIPMVNDMIVKFISIFNDNASKLEFAESLGAVDPILVHQIKFIVSKQGDLSNIDFAKFNNGSIHWLAIKAFYNGLDSSFIQGRYRMATAFKEWYEAGNLVGLKDLVDSYDPISAFTSWAHFIFWRSNSGTNAWGGGSENGTYISDIKFRASMNIDEVLKPLSDQSININNTYGNDFILPHPLSLWGITDAAQYMRNMIAVADGIRDDWALATFPTLINKFKDDYSKSANGLAITNSFYLPSVNTKVEDKDIKAWGIAELQPLKDSTFTNVVLSDIDETNRTIKITADVANNLISSQIEHVSFTVNGFNAPATVVDANVQLSDFRKIISPSSTLVLTSSEMKPSSWGIPGVFDFPNGSGVKVVNKDLSKITALYWNNEDPLTANFFPIDFNLSNVGTVLSKEDIMRLISSSLKSNPNFPSTIYNFDRPGAKDLGLADLLKTIDKLYLVATVAAVDTTNPATAIVKFSADVYPMGGDTKLDSFDFSVTLPTN